MAYGVRKYDDKSYSVSSEQAAQIHVKRLNEKGRDVELKATGHFWCWSPDGNKLAVTTVLPSDDNWLVVQNAIVDVTTGESEALHLPAGHLITDWSRDGKWFCTISVAPKQQDDSPPVAMINLVTTDGTTVRPVKGSAGGVFGRISPDGQKLLFVPVDSNKNISALFVIDINRGKRRLVTGGDNFRITGFSWAPDGKRFACTYKILNGDPGENPDTETFLEIIRLDETGSRILHEVKVLAGEFSNTQMVEVLAEPDWR